VDGLGNVGVRVAETDVNGRGYTPSIGAGGAAGPRVVTAENQYWDTLPSVNAAFEVTDDIIVRFGAAKVMARPQLINLAPTLNSLTIPATANALGAVTLGNIDLKPFRATNYDLDAEWYFAPGSLFTIALFRKDISNFPQTIASEETLQSLVSPDDFNAILRRSRRTRYMADERGQRRPRPRGAPVPECARRPIDGYEINFQTDPALPGSF
jgi:TonB-dependent receptor